MGAPRVPSRGLLKFDRSSKHGEVPYALHFGEEPGEKLVEIFPLLGSDMTSYATRINSARVQLQRAFDARCRQQKKSRGIE